MAKITLTEPNGPYHCNIDTDSMDVEIKDVFLGVGFVTEKGDRLSVSMRDDGYEVRYSGMLGDTKFDTGWTRFNNGEIKVKK